jgi:3,4-dihydroxy 2-butanone 4-phosphate synthase/GTP cyclohydrolase II
MDIMNTKKEGNMQKSIHRVQEAIAEIKKGNMIIMIDDEDRENEGDIVYAATFSTPKKVNFLCNTCKRSYLCRSL